MMFACKNVVPLKIHHAKFRVVTGYNYGIDYTRYDCENYKYFASQAWEVYTHGINIV